MNRDKRQVRSCMRNAQDRLPEEYISQASAIIQNKILSMEKYNAAKTVFLYVSTEKGPSTQRIMNHALQAGKKVFIPKCVNREEMLAVRISSLNQLLPGSFGIFEPQHWTEEITADALDFILVPCVCASMDGKRLGQGAGYYDRFLATKADNAICLCFHRLLRSNIPITENDVRIPIVITEQD